MFNRNRCLRRVAAIASISSLLAGCGVLSSDSPEDEGPIVVGTTSSPSTLDPAASWDSSWELFRNLYQTLLSYPIGATTPQPDAAENCEFSDTSNQVFRCELREGLTFSDGSTLDAKAVKHSIDRIRQINVNGGPAGLLGSLERVQAPSEREVVFYLNKPDATFPFVLATPAMSIVDPDSYPAGCSARTRASSDRARTPSSRTRRARRPSWSATTSTRGTPSGRTTRSPSATTRTPARW